MSEEYLNLLVYHMKTPTGKKLLLESNKKIAKILETMMLESFVGGFSHGKDEIDKAKAYFKRKFAEATVEADPSQEVVPEQAIAWYETYSVYLAGVYSEAILTKAEEIVTDALKEGLHLKDIVKTLQSNAEFNSFSENRLKTISRTETTKGYNKGRLEQFRASGDYVQAVQYSAILDRRTTQICKRLHGKIMDINNKLVDVFLPPNHYNCRSIIVPVTKFDDWKESSFDDVERPIPGFDNPLWNPGLKN
jgi:SPP1 gp7 family putative phage head morphogenesis protein